MCYNAARLRNPGSLADVLVFEGLPALAGGLGKLAALFPPGRIGHSAVLALERDGRRWADPSRAVGAAIHRLPPVGS